jgi:hypothetical protein
VFDDPHGLVEEVLGAASGRSAAPASAGVPIAHRPVPIGTGCSSVRSARAEFGATTSPRKHR